MGMNMKEQQQEQRRRSSSLKRFGGSKTARTMKIVNALHRRTAEMLSQPSGYALPPQLRTSTSTFAKPKEEFRPLVCSFCGARKGQPCKTVDGALAKKSHSVRNR